MSERIIAKADAGDFHFELAKDAEGKFKCLRSDVSDPMKHPEEVTDLKEIPPTVFSIFNGLMY